jgi:hypothetical protein
VESSARVPRFGPCRESLRVRIAASRFRARKLGCREWDEIRCEQVREGPRGSRLSPNCRQGPRKTGKNGAIPEKTDSSYVAAGKGISLNFVPDSEGAISAFKTAAFDHSAAPQRQPACDIVACGPAATHLLCFPCVRCFPGLPRPRRESPPRIPCSLFPFA